MSDFDDQISTAGAICPYCEHEHFVEGECYGEDGEESPEECESCGKNFYLSQSYTIDHCTSPDCELNDEEHDMKRKVSDDGIHYAVCRVCGKVRVGGEEA